jgi:hypothetical protein
MIYSESEGEITYTASGWAMRNRSFLTLPARNVLNPAKQICGANSLQAAVGGAVAWQHPADDWGDRRGGFDLTGAKRLVF